MSQHRVYLIWNHALLAEAVRRLVQQAGIEWAGSSSSLEDGLRSIEQLHPDTIFVEEREGGGIPEKIMQFFESSKNGMRVFRLNLANNILLIYYREQKTVLQAEELLQLIQNHDGE